MGKPNIFMSYSRREVSFVNNLVDDLEDNGFDVWLDYRSLVPGTPWAGQIDKGIQESEVVLLVISKASIASEPDLIGLWSFDKKLFPHLAPDTKRGRRYRELPNR